MVTAKHCLFDKDNKPFENLFITQILENGQYIMRPIINKYYNDSLLIFFYPLNCDIILFRELKFSNKLKGIHFYNFSRL